MALRYFVSDNTENTRLEFENAVQALSFLWEKGGDLYACDLPNPIEFKVVYDKKTGEAQLLDPNPNSTVTIFYSFPHIIQAVTDAIRLLSLRDLLLQLAQTLNNPEISALINEKHIDRDTNKFINIEYIDSTFLKVQKLINPAAGGLFFFKRSPTDPKNIIVYEVLTNNVSGIKAINDANRVLDEIKAQQSSADRPVPKQR